MTEARRPRVLMQVGEMPVFETWVRAASLVADVTTLAIGSNGERAACADIVLDDRRLPGGRVTSSVNDFVMAERLEREVKRRKLGIDVVHAHFSAAARCLPRFKKSTGVPFVVTEHSTAFTGQNPEKGPMTRGRCKRARHVFDTSSCVLPVSQTLADAIVDLTSTKAPIRVLRNPGDSDLFHSDAGRHSSGEYRIVSVGRLHPVKNQVILLEALRALSHEQDQVMLDIVGDGKLRSSLEGAATRLAVRDRVIFHGSLPSADVAEVLRTADAFALPSLTENCSVAIIEALLTGLPVLAGDSGGNRELVGPADGRVIDPQLLTGWVDAIDALASGALRFDRTAIETRAREKFGLEAIASELETIYRNALRKVEGVTASS